MSGIPESCYSWQYGPETPEYVTTCAGCKLGMSERDPSYPTTDGRLIHADLSCAVMALNAGDEPPCSPAGEYLRAMHGHEGSN